MAETADTRCGFIALIGAPNAGKSTLTNALTGSKVAIVTPKVQTTRTLIRGIAMVGNAQLVFIDGGYDAAEKMIGAFWKERMLAPTRPLRDPKTMLQEWAQARGLPTPAYREVERTGPHHDPEFRVSVTLPQREPAEGIGRSKRVAEQAAAAAMLAREGVKIDG